MTENVCVTCQYYESCNRPERFMKCMGYKRELQVGDTIQCGDTDDVVKTMKDLAKDGVKLISCMKKTVFKAYGWK